jgi:hypothetical protein
MGRQKAIIFALACSLAAALGPASMAGAEDQVTAHSHTDTPRSVNSASMAGVREQGGGISLKVAGSNNSGVTGTAMLRSIDGDKTEVEVLENGGGAGQQPIHIHEGACADLNPVPKIPLTTVVNGASTTMLDGSLQQLTSSPHVIFMPKSPEELPIFVACADITVVGELATLPSTGEPVPWVETAIGLSGFGLALAVAGYALRRHARRAWASTRRGAG